VELCQIFARLEVQLRSFDAARPQKYRLPRLMPKAGPAVEQRYNIQQTFKKFSTLEEARRSRDLLMPRVMDVHPQGNLL